MTSSFQVPPVQGVLVGLSGVPGPSGGPPGPKGDPGPPGPAGASTLAALTDVSATGLALGTAVDAAAARAVLGVVPPVPVAADDVAALTHAAVEVTAVVDADEFSLADSADSFKLKRFSWASLKAAVGAWYDTVATTMTNKTLSSPVINNIAGPTGKTVLSLLTAGDAENGYLGIANGAVCRLLGTATPSNPDVNVAVHTAGAGETYFFHGSNTLLVLKGPAGINRFELIPSSVAGTPAYLRVLPQSGQAADAVLDVVAAGGVSVNGDPVVTATAPQTLAGKTLASPVITGPVPATATSAGSAGQIAFDSGFVYVCVAANTWMRAALTTW